VATPHKFTSKVIGFCKAATHCNFAARPKTKIAKKAQNLPKTAHPGNAR
jgi:hypothetical protein